MHDCSQSHNILYSELYYTYILVQRNYSLCFSSDVLKFDNSRSWTRSKEIYYSVKMLPRDTSGSLPTSPMSVEEGGSDSEEFYDCETEDGGLQMNCPSTGSAVRTPTISTTV